MAVKVGKQSEERVSKKYIGIAALNVLSVNPKKDELLNILGSNNQDMDEPEYIGKTEDGKETVKITFWCRVNPEARINGGADFIIPLNFNLIKTAFTNSANTKVKIIDKYGRTAWALREEAEAHKIPMYSNGPARIAPDYKICIKGQDKLVDFLAAWLNVQSVDKYNSKTKTYSQVTNPGDCEVSIEHIDNLFKGDVSELSTLVKGAPMYLFKAAIGIRTTDKGNVYQTIYNNMILKNSQTNYAKLAKEIASSKVNGAYGDTDFDTHDLHEYVEETEFQSDAPVQEKARQDKWGDF